MTRLAITDFLRAQTTWSTDSPNDDVVAALLEVNLNDA
jgi:hypothetical protein